MLLREVRVWSKLTHENILPLLGIWENFNVCGIHNGTLGLVSPWSEKGTLQSYLRKNPDTRDAEKMRLVRLTVIHISLSDSYPKLLDIANALRYREPAFKF